MSFLVGQGHYSRKSKSGIYFFRFGFLFFMQQTVFVLGLGVSGRASAAFLLGQGKQVVGADRRAMQLREEAAIQALLSRGMRLVSDEAALAVCDQLVLSPGIPLTHPLVVEARERGVEVVGEVELALRQIRNRCVAITGSNGKTTTVSLLVHLLQKAGRKARALGNIGSSLAEYLLQPDEEEILVVELSSFQLETLSVQVFEAAAVLNITPNHLNWHPTMEAYARAKLRVAGCLKKGGKLFVSEQVASDFGHLLEDFDLFDKKSIAWNRDLSYIKRGLPESENIQAAFAFAEHFGLEEYARDVETFAKPPHRIEWVRERLGVSYFNDSKASNVHAVLHAVSLFEGPLVLLVGGVHKGASYGLWREPFQRKVKRIIAFGESSAQMEAELSSTFPFLRVSCLEEAVKEASREAKRGDTVLLSPGCSSYDQFRSFEHRGEEFKRIVRCLP